MRNNLRALPPTTPHVPTWEELALQSRNYIVAFLAGIAFNSATDPTISRFIAHGICQRESDPSSAYSQLLARQRRALQAARLVTYGQEARRIVVETLQVEMRRGGHKLRMESVDTFLAEVAALAMECDVETYRFAAESEAEAETAAATKELASMSASASVSSEGRTTMTMSQGSGRALAELDSVTESSPRRNSEAGARTRAENLPAGVRRRTYAAAVAGAHPAETPSARLRRGESATASLSPRLGPASSNSSMRSAPSTATISPRGESQSHRPWPSLASASSPARRGQQGTSSGPDPGGPGPGTPGFYELRILEAGEKGRGWTAGDGRTNTNTPKRR